MKQPIATEDIRAGDLIRWESADSGRVVAREYRATGTETTRPGDRGRLFLLERPVAVPPTPTLGWLSPAAYEKTHLGVWESNDDSICITAAPGGILSTQAARVTGFVEAVAVPKDALVALREVAYGPAASSDPGINWRRLGDAVKKMLDATDKANA